MQEVELAKAARLLYPRLTILVTTANAEGMANAAPYSWIAPVSFSPAMLYLGIQRRETLTIKNMRETCEFVVNVVTKGWAKNAVACEAKDSDKMKKSGLKLRESKAVGAPSAAAAKIVLECKLSEIIEAKEADHYIVVGKILHAEIDESIKNSEIVMHLSGEKFILPGKEIEIKRHR